MLAFRHLPGARRPRRPVERPCARPSQSACRKGVRRPGHEGRHVGLQMENTAQVRRLAAPESEAGPVLPLVPVPREELAALWTGRGGAGDGDCGRVRAQLLDEQLGNRSLAVGHDVRARGCRNLDRLMGRPPLPPGLGRFHAPPALGGEGQALARPDRLRQVNGHAGRGPEHGDHKNNPENSETRARTPNCHVRHSCRSPLAGLAAIIKSLPSTPPSTPTGRLGTPGHSAPLRDQPGPRSPPTRREGGPSRRTSKATCSHSHHRLVA